MDLVGVEGRGVEEAMAVLAKFGEERGQAMRFDLSLEQRRRVWAGLRALLADTSKAQVSPVIDKP